MIKKYHHEIFAALLIALSATAFYLLYGLLLPFIIGLILAFASLPAIKLIQKLFKVRALAITLFLVVVSGVFILFFVFLGQYINKDFERLNHSFHVLASQNQGTLDKTEQKIKEYIGDIYNLSDLEGDLKAKVDSLSTQFHENGTMEIDTEAIGDAFEKIASFFQKDSSPVAEKNSGFSFLFILLSSVAYFVLILYNIEYFILKKEQYFSGKIESRFQGFISDFDQSFVKYFKLRTKIILILSILYIIAFIILDMPGMILFTLLIVIFSYIPYFQYIILIPISIGCLVLSIENNHNFFIYYGIVVGVFVLASLIEELVLNPLIMEKRIGLNPVIMVLGISIWSYVLGIPGLFLGIPLTVLITIYIKRYLLESSEFKNMIQK